MFVVNIPPLVNNDKVKHYATSWVVYKDKDLTETVYESLEDTEDLYKKIINLDLNDDTVYYVRTKFHFLLEDGSKKETNWSRPVIVTKGSEGISSNNSLILTPKLELDINPNNVPLGSFKVTSSEYRDLMSNTKHVSSEWVIEELLGDVVWTSGEDKNNLTSIILPDDILKPDKAYFIKVRYKNNFGNYSNWGTIVIKTRKEIKTTTDTISDSDAEILRKLVATAIYSSIEVNTSK